MRYALIAVVLLLTGCGLSPNYMSAQLDAEMSRYKASCEKLGLAGRDAADCAVRMFEANRGTVINAR